MHSSRCASRARDLVLGATLHAFLASLAVACSGGGGAGAPDAGSGASTDGAPKPGDGGAGGDGAHPRDAAPEADRLDGSAAPIVAPDDTWTWVDVPASKCAAGTPTGFAVNPHAGATELLVYLEGGGECTDSASCWGSSPTATNLTGYDESTFKVSPQVRYPALVRAFKDNPFAAMNMAYVPYCTGDLHAGDLVADLEDGDATKPTYFWGGHDIDLFLQRLVPTFPSLSRVYLLGTSAGGFGTMIDFDRFAKAFGVRVDILDDSGPPLVYKGGTSNKASLDAWGYVPPAGCSSCDSYQAILAFDRASQPSSRYGLLSFTEDTVISVDFGYTPEDYPQVMKKLSASLAGDPGAATYLVSGVASHVVESDLSIAPDYLPWMSLLVSDDPSWGDVLYPAGGDAPPM